METKGHICGNCEDPNRPSICAACVNRELNQKYEDVNALQHNRDSLHKRLDEKIKGKHEEVEQQHWRLIHTTRIAQLKETLRLKQDQLCREKSELEEKTTDLNSRKILLDQTFSALETIKPEQLKLHSDLMCTQNSTLTAVRGEILQIQSVAIKQLCKVFPLHRVHKPSDGENRDEGYSEKYYYDQICNVPLPRGLDPKSVTPKELAVSLGYMVQLLNLVVRYLHAPLLLDSGFAGSCSRVWQRASCSVSQLSKPEYYPLFFPRKNNSTHASRKCSIDFDLAASLLDFDVQKSMVKDVEDGIHLLKRAVACVTAYCFNSFTIPLPAEISTFEAFEMMLKFISSRDEDAATFLKEMQSRCRRRGLSLLDSSDSAGISSSCLQESKNGRRLLFLDSLVSEIPSSSLQESKNSQAQTWMAVNKRESARSPVRSTGLRTTAISDMREAEDDGWEVVEDLPLPPPPSHSQEDIENWISAMIPAYRGRDR